MCSELKTRNGSGRASSVRYSYLLSGPISVLLKELHTAFCYGENKPFEGRDREDRSEAEDTLQ